MSHTLETYSNVSLQLLSWSSARTSYCHQRCCEKVFNEAAMRLNEHWSCAPNGSSSRKLADTDTIQRCNVHMNRKQSIPQIWTRKYWITSTMSWRTGARGEIMGIIGNDLTFFMITVLGHHTSRNNLECVETTTKNEQTCWGYERYLCDSA